MKISNIFVSRLNECPCLSKWRPITETFRRLDTGGRALGWAQERFCLVFRRYIVIDRLLKKYG